MNTSVPKFKSFIHATAHPSHALQAFVADVAPKGSVVTIGNFDGCHRGHQSLLTAAKELAARDDLAAVGFTFSPRPEAFFKKAGQESLLFTEAQKSRAFAEQGMAAQVIQMFDHRFSQLTHHEFYDLYLRRGLHARGLTVGDNFRFGCGRKGDADFLKARGVDEHLAVIIGSPAQEDALPISSTRIRDALTNSGNVELAASMLGRPYMIEGMIRQGDQLGRTLGVPTANLEGTAQIVPAYGIYAGYVYLSEGDDDEIPVTYKPKTSVPAVFSIGIRPTLGRAQSPVRIEAHILGVDIPLNSLYQRRAGYYLRYRLRGEERFAGLEDLKNQMQLDIAKAKALLG